MRKQLFLFLSLALSQTVFSQTDSLFAAASAPRTATHAGDPLFYGPQYVGYQNKLEGIPFYATEEWQKGSIVYRDVAYRDVVLRYDLVKDEVMVLHPNGFTPVVLFTPRIQSFMLGDKKFVYLPGSEIEPYKAGVYEELSTGGITLYAKRSKLLNETIVANELERKVADNYSFYVKKDGRFIPIKKEKAIMELVGEKKKEAKSLLKKAGIKFRKRPEEALLMIVNFYNQSSR